MRAENMKALKDWEGVEEYCRKISWKRSDFNRNIPSVGSIKMEDGTPLEIGGNYEEIEAFGQCIPEMGVVVRLTGVPEVENGEEIRLSTFIRLSLENADLLRQQITAALLGRTH